MNGMVAILCLRSFGFFLNSSQSIQVHIIFFSQPNSSLLQIWSCIKRFGTNAGKMLCYCRLVYMPMSYLYGKRFVGTITDLIKSMRKELYTQPYHTINWNKARNTVAKVTPHIINFTFKSPDNQLSFWCIFKFAGGSLLSSSSHTRYDLGIPSPCCRAIFDPLAF